MKHLVTMSHQYPLHSVSVYCASEDQITEPLAVIVGQIVTEISTSVVL